AHPDLPPFPTRRSSDLRANDCTLSHATRNDSGVTRHPAARREHRLRGNDSVKVLRRRLVANKNHIRAAARALLSNIWIEHGNSRSEEHTSELQSRFELV